MVSHVKCKHLGNISKLCHYNIFNKMLIKKNDQVEENLTSIF